MIDVQAHQDMVVVDQPIDLRRLQQLLGRIDIARGLPMAPAAAATATAV